MMNTTLNLTNVKPFADRHVATTYLIRNNEVVGFIDTSDTEPLINDSPVYETMPKIGESWLDECSFTADDKVTAYENHNALVTLMKNKYDAKAVLYSFIATEVITDKETKKIIEKYRNR